MEMQKKKFSWKIAGFLQDTNVGSNCVSESHYEMLNLADP